MTTTDLGVRIREKSTVGELFLQANRRSAVRAAEPAEQENVDAKRKNVSKQTYMMGPWAFQMRFWNKKFLAANPATADVAKHRIKHSDDRQKQRKNDDPRWHP